MFDKMTGVENLISLAVGEPDASTHPDIVAAGCRALKDGYTRYTPNAGYMTLREAISATFLPELAYKPDGEIIVTVGAMGALSTLFHVLISPGDEVIVPEPTWVNYYTLISFPGGVPVPVRSSIDQGFKVTAQDIEAKITAKTKAILINNPSNPTGAVMTDEDLKEIAQLAVDKDLLVISDEIYGMLLFDGLQVKSLAQFPEMRERTVVINGFSKAFNMTGWRVGFALGPEAIIRKMTILQENIISCVPASSQMAAQYALSRLDTVQHTVDVYREKRDLVYDGLAKISGIRCIKPMGAFYIFPDISAVANDATKFCYDLLAMESVACVPGDAFGESGKGHIRISYANSVENLKESLARIQHFVSHYGIEEL